MRIFFTRCLRRNAKPTPLPSWDEDIAIHFHRTNGSFRFKARHVDTWWNRLKHTELKLNFNVRAMIQMYMHSASTVGPRPFTFGPRLTSPFKAPSPVIYFDADLAVQHRIQWLMSKLPEKVDEMDVLSALEALQAQFDSNRQSCALKLSGVKRKFEQAYSLE
jgi:hypothetical protein